MRRVLVVLVAAAALFATSVVASCGTIAGTSERTSSSASPTSDPASQPPAWLWKEAWRRAAEAEGPVRGGYWGLLGDPEYGELMASGPRDPSHPRVWVLVLVGHFTEYLRGGPVAAGVTPSPRGPADFVEYTYTEASHRGAGVFGYGWGEFDASPYPHLRPFSSSSPPTDNADVLPQPPEGLKEQALLCARNDQDPRPYWAGWGRMALKEAAPAVGLASEDPGVGDKVVYLVVLRGRFVHEHAYVPPGVEDPKGGWVAFTIDASTGGSYDYSIRDSPPPRQILDRLTPLLF